MEVVKIKIIRQNISMVRGDTEHIALTIRDNGEIVPLEDGDTIYMTVKKSVDDVEKQFQVVVKEFDEGKAIIRINPEDTKEMEYGGYVYDIQLTTKDGDITTIIPAKKFYLEGEVTYE